MIPEAQDNQIHVFHPSGKWIKTIRSPDFKEPHGIRTIREREGTKSNGTWMALDRAGNLVMTAHLNQVEIYSPEGILRKTFILM